MSTPAGGKARDRGGQSWTPRQAEELISSLKGVVSVQVVTGPKREIAEIHLLTSEEVLAKQTVRNVESALMAHLGLSVDHRKISVAQMRMSEGDRSRNSEASNVVAVAGRQQGPVKRVRFMGYQVGSQGAHRVQAKVVLGWRQQRHFGKATGTDLPRTRLELAASAVLRCMESIVETEGGGSDPEFDEVVLTVDGVTIVDAFGFSYALVGVRVLHARQVLVLSGSAPVKHSDERAVVLATLKATDRWVRGRILRLNGVNGGTSSK